MQHTVKRTVTEEPAGGWTVRFDCRACDWSSSATAPLIADAHHAQLAAKNAHTGSTAVMPATAARQATAVPTEQARTVDTAPPVNGGTGCLVPLVVLLVLIALLTGNLDLGGDTDEPTYSPEECTALQLSGISGDSDSAAEWSLNC